FGKARIQRPHAGPGGLPIYNAKRPAACAAGRSVEFLSLVGTYLRPPPWEPPPWKLPPPWNPPPPRTAALPWKPPTGPRAAAPPRKPPTGPRPAKPCPATPGPRPANPR